MLIFETIADRLNSPRSLEFDAQGRLYIAEAGRGGGGTGPSVPSPSLPGAQLDYGATGSIARLSNVSGNGTLDRPYTNLPSLALPDGSDASGLNDLLITEDGTIYGLFGFASNPANRDPNTVCSCAVPQASEDLSTARVQNKTIGVVDFGQLVRFDSTGNTWTRLADLTGFEAVNNPNGDDFNSNPYKFLLRGSGSSQEFVLLDTGANAALRANLDGSNLRVLTLFPSRSVPSPFPGGERTLTMQSVPTSVIEGPDGSLYFSELTGVPFPTDGARIYRQPPGGGLQTFREGVTQAIDLELDSKGGLYVLEYAAESLLAGNPIGGLVYFTAEGQRSDLALGNELIFPTAVTLGPDNALYVANRGFVAGQGEVLRAVNGRRTDGGLGNDDFSGDRASTLELLPPTDNSVTTDLNSDMLVGGPGNDRLNGLSRADVLYGNSGNDTLNGGTGNDTLHGGRGPDLLLGEEGNDWLWGDRGSDTLTGGPGADSFALGNGQPEQGIDTVTDFQSGVDRLVLPAGITFATLSLTPGEGVVTVAANGLVLAKVAGAGLTLTAADFLSLG